MSLLSPADQEKLRESFDEMTSPVRVLFFTQTLDCEPCVQTRQILDELPPLSDKIAIEEVNFILEKDKAAQYGIDRVPALALVGQDAAGEAHCPRAVSLAHEMAFANQHITAYAVEATEFPDLARKYRVNGVPKTVVNDQIEIMGGIPQDDFIEQALVNLQL
jgi:thiol-disulfide isomerase/thioredoxin